MKTKYSTAKARRLFRELTEELQRMEHSVADEIDGFDATDELTNIRAARDKAVDGWEALQLVPDEIEVRQ